MAIALGTALGVFVAMTPTIGIQMLLVVIFGTMIGAAGTRIQLADGRELIDGMASWWSAIHGYNHPRLNDAVRVQLDAMISAERQIGN